MSSHEARLRVRYAETDQMGVAYHANYFVWMEVGRVEYCRAAGLRYRDFEKDTALHLAVVEATCRFLSPARYDDEIIVRTSVREAGSRRVVFAYEIVRAETGHRLATGTTRHIFLGADFKPCRLPEKYRAVFGAAAAVRASAGSPG